jgi:hypothetical protein
MSNCNLERKSGQPRSQKGKGMLQVAPRGETLSDDLAGGEVVGLEGKKGTAFKWLALLSD